MHLKLMINIIILIIIIVNQYDFLHSDIGYKLLRLDKYFSQSEITKDKLDMIEKRTGLNMTKYRSKIERKKLL